MCILSTVADVLWRMKDSFFPYNINAWREHDNIAEWVLDRDARIGSTSSMYLPSQESGQHGSEGDLALSNECMRRNMRQKWPYTVIFWWIGINCGNWEKNKSMYSTSLWINISYQKQYLIEIDQFTISFEIDSSEINIHVYNFFIIIIYI